MKSLTVWHGHSTRPSLPVGTVRKASGSLPHGRQNRLITQTTKNRKLPLGNSLLYISLLSVAFGRARPVGRTLFLCCLFQMPHFTPNLTADALIFFVPIQELLQPILQQIVFLFIRHKNQILSYFILTVQIKVLLPSSR